MARQQKVKCQRCGRELVGVHPVKCRTDSGVGTLFPDRKDLRAVFSEDRKVKRPGKYTKYAWCIACYNLWASVQLAIDGQAFIRRKLREVSFAREVRMPTKLEDDIDKP